MLQKVFNIGGIVSWTVYNIRGKSSVLFPEVANSSAESSMEAFQGPGGISRTSVASTVLVRKM